MPDQHAARREALRAHLAGRELDSALVTRLVHVRYLSGFSGSNGALLVTADDAVLVTDARYEIQARDECPDLTVVIDRALGRAALSAAAARSISTLAFEDHHVTVATHRSLLAVAGPLRLAALGTALEAQRAVKDAAEVALIARACAVTDAAFAELLAVARAGMTEAAAAQVLDQALRDHGGDGPGFDTIVASGPNAARPHHRPADRALADGDLVVCDFGARLAGYHADMTRTFAVGRVAPWQREVYAVVAEAHAAGRAAAVPGAACRAVDAAARAVVERSAFRGCFVHGLGHGVGLEIHEAPWLGQTADGALATSNTVTVEPGVYVPGRGGVRIEDTFVVEPAGARPLTTTSRELAIV